MAQLKRFICLDWVSATCRSQDSSRVKFYCPKKSGFEKPIFHKWWISFSCCEGFFFWISVFLLYYRSVLGGFTCCEDDVSDRTFSLVGVGHEIFCRQSVGSWRLGWVCCTSLLGFLKACNVGHHICFAFRIWTAWWFVSSRRLYHRRKIWPRRVIWWGRR